MSPLKTAITRADIMPLADYARLRPQRRHAMVEAKRHRRVAVGPNATFHFENFATMLHQVHEMLFIEQGGAAQIDGELDAYNPLVPKGNELVATLMLEVEDPVQRAGLLARLGGIEETVTLEFGGQTVRATWEKDVERTTADGKTSAVHFLHFPMTPAQAAGFKTPGTRVVLAIGHRNYGHMTVLPEDVRAALAGDLD
jgi:hypothetical protein